MKKLCRKGTVHPSPPPAVKSNDQFLSLLPVAILSLVAALSAEDREVLAYLISNSSLSGDPNRLKNNNKTQNSSYHHHSPLFLCDCFSCYTSYWVRWDSSPNRKLIHEIIDAYEDSLETAKKRKKKERRKRSGKASSRADSVCPSRLSELGSSSNESVGGDDSVQEAGEAKGSVVRVMSFIGQKFFGVWG